MIALQHNKVSKLSLGAAYGAIALPAVFLALLLTLHFIEPEIQPWWRLISEYELGQFGWMMHLAFIILVLGALCLFVALRPHIRSKGGYAGLFLLLTTAAGMTLGALFVTDPITTPRAEFSQSGIVHNLGGALMIFSSPFLISLTSWSLVRYSPGWRSLKQPLLWLSLLNIASVVTFAVLSSVQYRGVADDTMTIGWPNRALMLAYCLWIIVTGWHARKLALQNDVFYVFGRYPSDTAEPEYPVIDLVVCHGDFINANHDYVHQNKSFKGFGSYGDLLVRDRKMYVAPTPFALIHGATGQKTLILPAEYDTDDRFECVGELVRAEAQALIIGYEFDLTTNELTPKTAPNPHAGKEHSFKAYRIKGAGGDRVSMSSSGEIKQALAEAAAQQEQRGGE